MIHWRIFRVRLFLGHLGSRKVLLGRWMPGIFSFGCSSSDHKTDKSQKTEWLMGEKKCFVCLRMSVCISRILYIVWIMYDLKKMLKMQWLILTGGPSAKVTATPHCVTLLTALKRDNIPLFKMCAAKAKKGTERTLTLKNGAAGGTLSAAVNKQLIQKDRLNNLENWRLKTGLSSRTAQAIFPDSGCAYHHWEINY